jgi:anti-sigma-K factor RskA
MNDPARQNRFDELDAARALGDLSPDEEKEWLIFLEEEFKSDPDLDWIAAGLDVTLAPTSEVGPGKELKERLISDNVSEKRVGSGHPRNVVPFWKRTIVGLAVAAGLAIGLFIGLFLTQKHSPDPVASSEARRALLQRSDAVELPFTATPAFPDLKGTVVWADGVQEGYLLFTGLAANDPSESQYQLWIVDPNRDAKPVDGGVFDIPESTGPVLVSVRSALTVANPVAFVVTVEKPGGVVVSDQKRVAAIAQRG